MLFFAEIYLSRALEQQTTKLSIVLRKAATLSIPPFSFNTQINGADENDNIRVEKEIIRGEEIGRRNSRERENMRGKNEREKERVREEEEEREYEREREREEHDEICEEKNRQLDLSMVEINRLNYQVTNSLKKTGFFCM